MMNSAKKKLQFQFIYEIEIDKTTPENIKAYLQKLIPALTITKFDNGIDVKTSIAWARIRSNLIDLLIAKAGAPQAGISQDIFEAAVKSLNDQIMNYDNENTALKTEISKLKVMSPAKDIKTEIENYKREITNLKDALENKNKLHANQTKSLENELLIRNKLEAKIRAYEEAEQKILMQQERMRRSSVMSPKEMAYGSSNKLPEENFDESIMKLKLENEEKAHLITKLDVEIKELRAKMIDNSSLTKQNEDSLHKQEQFLQQINSLNLNISLLKESIAQKQIEIASLASNRDQLLEQIKEKDTNIKQLEDKQILLIESHKNEIDKQEEDKKNSLVSSQALILSQSNFQDTIKAKENDINSLNNQLKDANSQIKSLNDSQNNIINEKQSISQELAKAQGDYLNLKNIYDDTIKNYNSQSKSTDEKQNIINQLMESEKSAREKASSLELSLSNKSNDIKSLNEKLIAKESEYSALNEKYQSKESALAALQIKLDDANRLCEKSVNEKNSIETKMSKAITEKEELLGFYNKLNAKNEEALKSLATKEPEIQKLNAIISSHKNEIDIETKSKNELKNSITSLKAEILTLTNNRDQLVNKMSEQNDKITQSSKDYSELKISAKSQYDEMLQSKNSELSSCSTLLTEFNIKNRKLESDIKQLEEAKLTLNLELAKCKGELSTLKLAYDDNQKEIQNKMLNSSEKQQMISNLMESEKQYKDKLLLLENEIKNKLSEISTLREKVALKENEYQSQAIQYQTKEESLKNKISDTNKLYEQSLNAQKELENKISLLTTEKAAQNTTINKLTNDYNDIKRSYEETQNKISEKTSELHSVNASNKSEIENKSKEITNLGNIITKLRSDEVALKMEIDNLKKSISSSNDRITELTNENALQKSTCKGQYDSMVQSKTNEINSITSLLNDSNSKISKLESDLKVAENLKSTFAQELAKAKGDYLTLKTSYDETQKDFLDKSKSTDEKQMAITKLMDTDRKNKEKINALDIDITYKLAEINSLKDAIIKKETEYKALLEQSHTKDTSLAVLQIKYDESVKQIERVGNEKGIVEGKMTKIINEKEETNSNYQKVVEKLSEVQKEILLKEKEIINLNSMLESQKNGANDKNNEINGNLKTISSLKSEILAITNERDSLKKSMIEQGKKNDDLTKEYNEYKNKSKLQYDSLITNKSAEINGLSSQIEGLLNKIRDAESNSKSKEEIRLLEINQLKSQYSTLKQNSDNSIKALNEQFTQKELKINEQITTLKLDIQLKENAINNANAGLTESKKQILKATQDLQESTNSYNNLLAKYNDLISNKETIEKKTIALKKINNSITHVKAIAVLTPTLQSQLSKLKQHYESIISNLTSTNQILELKIANLEETKQEQTTVSNEKTEEELNLLKMQNKELQLKQIQTEGKISDMVKQALLQEEKLFIAFIANIENLKVEQYQTLTVKEKETIKFDIMVRSKAISSLYGELLNTCKTLLMISKESYQKFITKSENNNYIAESIELLNGVKKESKLQGAQQLQAAIPFFKGIDILKLDKSSSAIVSKLLESYINIKSKKIEGATDSFSKTRKLIQKNEQLIESYLQQLTNIEGRINGFAPIIEKSN